uniref:Uncharacterized protein n=1 Tax=Arundo donax TaxID=35708 RepID=A0A0A9A1J6_ARUDO
MHRTRWASIPARRSAKGPAALAAPEQALPGANRTVPSQHARRP